MLKVSTNKLLIVVFIIFLISGVLRIVFKTWPALKPAIGPVNTDITEKFLQSNEVQEFRVVPQSRVPTDFPLKINKDFSISVYANDLKNLRVLLFDSKQRLYVSLSNENKVIMLADMNSDGYAESKEIVLKNLNKPHGLAFFKDWLYVAETDKVMRYKYNSDDGGITVPGEKILELPAGGRHFTRTITFGNNNKLYISIGSSCDTCIEDDEKRASILELIPDGSNIKVYAKGLRNAVFMKEHPVSFELWATEMGRDHLGDNLPPDEVNIIKDGKGYGWPFCYGNKVYDAVYGGINNCEFSEPAFIEIPAHSAPLGLAFAPSEWGDEWENDLLIAYHGSWNKTEPTGYKIVRFDYDNGTYQKSGEDFISGWLQKDGSSLGRPVDLVYDQQDRLYISDDKAGVIYQVTKVKNLK